MSRQVVQPKLPRLHPVYFAIYDLPPANLRDEQRAEAIDVVKNWLGEKVTWVEPEDWEREVQETNAHDQSLRWVTDKANNRWACQLQQPDDPPQWRREQGDEPVPGRSWQTRITLWEEPGANGKRSRNRFGLQVHCLNRREYAGIPIHFSRPRIVRDLAGHLNPGKSPSFGKAVGLLDGEERLQDTPKWITSSQELQELAQLIHSPQRKLPLILAAAPVEAHRNKLGLEDRSLPFDEGYLASKLHGMAHVRVVMPDLLEALPEVLGGDLALGSGEVRYVPAGQVWAGSEEEAAELPALTQHFTADHIQHFVHDPKDNPDDSTIGQKAFSRKIKHLVEDRIRYFHPNHRDFPDYPSVRQAYADDLMAKLRESSQQSHRSEEEVEHLQMEIENLRENLKTTQRELEDAKNEASFYAELHDKKDEELQIFEDDNKTLNNRIDALKTQLEDRDGPATIPTPETYAEFEQLIKTHFPEDLVLHPRASKALKNNPAYEDVERAWEALKLLAGPYKEQKMGYDGANQRYEDQLKALHLEESKSAGVTTVGRHKNEYTVEYPPGSGHPRELDRHLKRGTGSDDRYLLRIYFFWDDDQNRVVVGSMPSHLSNSRS